MARPCDGRNSKRLGDTKRAPQPAAQAGCVRYREPYRYGTGELTTADAAVYRTLWTITACASATTSEHVARRGGMVLLLGARLAVAAPRLVAIRLGIIHTAVGLVATVAVAIAVAITAVVVLTILIEQE